MSTEDRIQSAHAAEIAADAFRPTDLRLDRCDGLHIQWADGKTAHLPLALLRKNCPCATCREKRDVPPTQAQGRSLTILPPGIDRAAHFSDARTVGHYAIQITWQDGHNTGIYDYRYLRTLADEGSDHRAPAAQSAPDIQA